MTTKFDGTALKKTLLDFGISQSELSVSYTHLTLPTILLV